MIYNGLENLEFFITDLKTLNVYNGPENLKYF